MVKIASVILYGALGGILFTGVAALEVAFGAEPCPWVNTFAFGAAVFAGVRAWYFARRGF